jgi:uncharacterized protein YhaN
MRLKSLNLKAFGPFTDRTLEFSSKEPGFHIIFGPNEAGKSSSLRALKALLYGFPQQTPDNFLHSYDQLLVGGCLENNAGEEIIFQRRKKRIGDIIDAEGNPLDPDDLTPFLHGVEPEIFESLYGIDHGNLVQGGKEILAQKGEVGQALFAAGAGISSLREVIDQLEKESLELFKSAGQLPKINKAVKRYKELQKEARAASLSAKDWKEHQKAFKNAAAERAGLEKERENKNRELHRLERLKHAIPELAVLKVLRNQLQELGEVTSLPPDFSMRHQQVVQNIRGATLQLQRDSNRFAQREEKRKAISLNKDLLSQTESVDDFHQRLGEYRKGQKDRPERNGMRINLRKEAALLLKQVRPDLPLDEVETVWPALVKKRTFQTLSAQYEASNQQLKQAHKQKKTAENELHEIEKCLAEKPETLDTNGLSLAVKMAQKAGDVDGQIERGRAEVERGKNECLQELKRIGLWTGDLAALMELSLPLPETVQQFERNYSIIAEERREQQKERKKAEKEMRVALTEIKKTEYAGEVPSESMLSLIREKREQGWQLLRRQWLEGQDVSEESQVYNSEHSLPSAYEKYVSKADLVADRLRREAERVANVAASRAHVETQNDILTDNDRVKEELTLREKDIDEAWTTAWQPVGIVPLSPKEMNGWLTEIDKLRYKVGEILKKDEEIERASKQQQHLLQKLIRELLSIGEEKTPEEKTLTQVVVLAETILERIIDQKMGLERLREQQKKAENNFGQSEDNLKTAQESLSQWQAEWRKALSSLGLKNKISPLEAVDLLDILQSCFDKVKEAEDLRKRIDGIDRDAGELEKEVKSLLAKVAPDMLPLPIDQAILQLRDIHSLAAKDLTSYDKLSEELDSLQEDISVDKKNMQSANEQMYELLRIAKCEKPEELATVTSKFAEYQKLLDKITNTETSIGKIGAGVSNAELARQALEINADELPGKIESLREDISERINPEINRISQVIGEETAKLAGMDGSAKAAEVADEMEQELARIRRLAERYARIKLASKILQQEIERYREEHQDPVLKIASRYFSNLTLGSFEGLRTDLDDRGEPVLVGTRPGGRWLSVEGMSDGTRDQLYLALRLATLEWRLEKSEPMPFIVDDILINFDDDRTRATLQILADLAAKNQVILFSHHRQIVEASSNITGKGTIHIHEL